MNNFFTRKIKRFQVIHKCNAAVLLSILLFAFIDVQAFPETIDGFITHIDSSVEFETGKQHIKTNKFTKCYYKTKKFIGFNSKAIACNVKNLPVGTLVSVTISSQNNDAIIAANLTINRTWTLRNSNRMEYQGWQRKGTFRRSALLEEKPDIQIGAREQGNLAVDGYPVTVDSKTILCATTASKLYVFSDFFCKTSFPERLLQPNVWLAYKARVIQGGIIVAQQINFLQNHVSRKEKEFLSNFTEKIKSPDYGKHIPGSIQYKGGDTINIVPNKMAQEFISRLGMEMVPQYQKDLKVNDPTKIKFRFYIVESFKHTHKNTLVVINGSIRPHIGEVHPKSLISNSQKRKTCVEDVIGMPDGVILITELTLSRLKNTSQLSALLSYAITAIIQKQAYNSWIELKPEPLESIYLYDFTLKYILYIHAQMALRLGIRQMYLAGYDIREAPYAWAVAQGKPVQNPIIDSKHPDKEIPWYAAYAFNYISQYYQDVDYSKLKRGEKEYQQFLQELYKADPALPKPPEPPQPKSPPPLAQQGTLPLPAPSTSTPPVLQK